MAELTVPQRQLLNRLLITRELVLNGRSRQQIETLNAAGLVAVSWGAKELTVVPRLPGSGSYASPLLISRDLLDLSRLRVHLKDWHGNSATRGVPNIRLATWHAAQHHRCSPRHAHGGPFTVILQDGRRPAGATARPVPLGWFTGQQPVTREELDRRRAARLSGRPENH